MLSWAFLYDFTAVKKNNNWQICYYFISSPSIKFLFSLTINLEFIHLKKLRPVCWTAKDHQGQAFRWRKCQNWRTFIHCIDGLGWAGLGAVISPLIYSGQMMNVSPVPVTLRRCSVLTGTQSLDPSHLQQQMNNWKMSRWPAPQFAVIISQGVLAVTLFRKRLVPAFCSAENFKNLQNCSGHFRNNKLLCPRDSGVSAP